METYSSEQRPPNQQIAEMRHHFYSQLPLPGPCFHGNSFNSAFSVRTGAMTRKKSYLGGHLLDCWWFQPHGQQAIIIPEIGGWTTQSFLNQPSTSGCFFFSNYTSGIHGIHRAFPRLAGKGTLAPAQVNPVNPAVSDQGKGP
jgi:hypothetical protein